jgi:hypothetical protein
MCPSLRSFQPTRPTDLIQLECPLNSTRRPRSALSAARLYTISQRCTRLRPEIARRSRQIAFVQWKLKPFALPGATQIRTVTTNGRTIMRFVLLNHRTPRRPPNCTESCRRAQCDRRIVKPVIAIRPNCQRATPRLCQPRLVRRYRVCVLRRALQCRSSTALESASLSRCSRRLVEQ